MDLAANFGLPVQPKEDGQIALVFKKVPLEDDPPRTDKAGSRIRDHRFAFGESFDVNETMRIESARIDQMLKFGFS